MKYFIFNEIELTPEVLGCLNLSDTRKLSKVTSDDGVDTGYRVVSKVEECNHKELVKFIRFSREEVISAVESLKAGITVNRTSKPVSKMSAFRDPEGKRARLQGAFKLVVPAGETVSQDFYITEDRYITGVWGRAFNSNFGDKLRFEVVHPYAGTLDTFADNWYVTDDPIEEHVYPAMLPAGLIIRMTYFNVGSNEVKFVSNLFLHKI